MKKSPPVDRRTFIGTTAATGLTAVSAKSYGRILGANDRLNIGFIGCGGIAANRRGAHLFELLKLYETENFEFVAMCDIWDQRAKAFRDAVRNAGSGNPDVIHDYHDLIARSDIDYVSIHTPEHWHAQMTIDSLDAGKHVYCEKPMTHKVTEAKSVLKKVKETGLTMQVGVQGMSDDSYISAHHAIREGKLGTVVQAQIDYVRNYYRTSYPDNLGPWRDKTIADNLPQPPDLDWESWLGPAPQRPWDPHRYFEWRNYRDYSGGVATDLFIHRLTRILKSCGLTEPKRAVGMGGIYLWPDGRELPDNFEMIVEYPAIEGITNGMTVYVLGTMANQYGNAHVIRGEQASLVFTKTGWQIISEREQGKVLETHTKSGAENIGLHHKNHFDTIRGKAELNCPAELGYAGVLAVDMANESWFKGKVLEWDSQLGEVRES